MTVSLVGRMTSGSSSCLPPPIVTTANSGLNPSTCSASRRLSRYWRSGGNNGIQVQPAATGTGLCPRRAYLPDPGGTRLRQGPTEEAAVSVYRVIDVIGTSTQSWEDAAVTAVNTARKSLRDLRVAEVVQQDLTIEDGGEIIFRSKLRLSFKYEDPA